MCGIVCEFVARQNRRSRNASTDQVVPQPEHVEQPRSPRLYCPPQGSTASAQGPSNLRNEGFFVQANETGAGVEVFDRNNQHVRTIDTSELCEDNENPRNTGN